MYLNKIQIIGNLTRDPEVKALPNGTQVASFSIATNRTWKDKDGQKKEEVEFHNLVAFGKQAEVIGQYMKKGSSMYVEGRNRTRGWEDKETGKKMYRTEIMVDQFQFGQKSTAPAKSPEDQSEDRAYEEHQRKVDADYDAIGNDDIDPADIPF